MHLAALNSAEDCGATTLSPWVSVTRQALGSHGVFVTFANSGRHLYAGAAHGAIRFRAASGGSEGTARIASSPLCMAPVGEDDLLIGTDSGRIMRLNAGGDLWEFFDAGHGWIEQLAVGNEDAIAVAAGRVVKLLDGAGEQRLDLGPQRSTPTGLAFDRDRRRLAIAHYDGVSVWDLGTGRNDLDLHWHGSHTLMAWSPDGRHIATATQDKELHAWRMPRGDSLKMSGYPSKIRSLSWTPDGGYLACAGADTITCWRFADGGPTGTAPLEFGYVFDSLVTQVAAHPRRPFIAGGYDNGSILVGRLSTCDALIASAGNAERITALAWSPLSDTLAAVGERGTLTQMDFAPQAFEPC